MLSDGMFRVYLHLFRWIVPFSMFLRLTCPSIASRSCKSPGGYVSKHCMARFHPQHARFGWSWR